MSRTLFEEWQMVFENVQILLRAALVLAAPWVGEQFSLQVDTSVWEQVLSYYREIIRESDGPVTFFSTKFKLNYGVGRKR